MISLLMIADDFTGALDSGVQFAKAGLKVRVVTDLNYELENAGDDTQVLVFDTESRHKSRCSHSSSICWYDSWQH